MWITAIFKFFSEVIQAIAAFFAAVVKWCREHPKAAIAILVLVVSNAVMWHYGGVHQANKDAVQITALKGEVIKANKETEARNEKIAGLEKDSKKRADEAQAALDDSKKKMNAIVSDFQRKLAAEKTKNKIVYVNSPTTKRNIPVEINPKGQVVCERLHDSLSDSLNELVQQVNKPVSTAK